MLVSGSGARIRAKASAEFPALDPVPKNRDRDDTEKGLGRELSYPPPPSRAFGSGAPADQFIDRAPPAIPRNPLPRNTALGAGEGGHCSARVRDGVPSEQPPVSPFVKGELVDALYAIWIKYCPDPLIPQDTNQLIHGYYILLTLK